MTLDIKKQRQQLPSLRTHEQLDLFEAYKLE